MVKFQEWTEIKQFHNLMVELEKTKEIYEKENTLFPPFKIFKGIGFYNNKIPK
jgi:hypothetical protein